jgi:L-ascorbate metabolism protein UlaG (beta-lactamase superfamily)
MKAVPASILILSVLTGLLFTTPLHFSSAQSMSTEEIKNSLLSNPPNTGDPMVRKQSILALDSILISDSARTAQSLFNMYTSMMNKVKTELRPKVDSGTLIWLMYNDGYIVKTPEIVFAFDLIGGYSGWNTQLPLELIDQIKVLFISHNHSDHVDENLAKRVKANGGFVVFPSEDIIPGNVRMAGNDTLTLQGLHIKAYNGLHGGMPLRIYEVICPSGLKFLHTGDNQTSQTLPQVNDVDVLLLNAWVNESGATSASIGMCNCVNNLNPKIMIPGHVQELNHNWKPGDPTSRLSYQAVYQIQDTSVASKTHAMIWGELYVVADDRPSRVGFDGLKDNFYNTLTGPNDGYLQIRSYACTEIGKPMNDTDLSAKIWTAWDDEWFYLYEEVKDDTLAGNAADVWEEDCLELKFDPQPTDSTTNSVWETRLTALDSGETGVVQADNLDNVADAQKQWIRVRTADGYILELALKWSAIRSGTETITPAVGNIFGLAINQYDNDGKAKLQAAVQWAAVLNNDVYRMPKYLGTVKFLTDNKLQFIPTNAMTGVTNPVPYDGSDYTPTRIKESLTMAPKAFCLEQNYPNPFNPTTTINFSVPLKGLVSLKVYDLLGRQVAVLINQILAPGMYKASFDSSHLTSGVYFYCLEAGNFRATHKLVLLK